MKLSTLKESRNTMVINYLLLYGGNRTRTAKAMDISVRSLRNYINEIRASGIKVKSAFTGSGAGKISLDEIVSKTDIYFPTNEERIAHADHMINATSL